MMKKKCAFTFITVLLVVLSTASWSQSLSINSPSYRTAIGLRGGDLGGFTIKHFKSSDRAIEAIIGMGFRDPRLFSLTVLAERHTQAFDISGMRWYYGGGGHLALVGSRSGYIRRPWFKERYYYESGAFGLGIDGVVGLEYKIPPIPFAISLDIKPYIEVFSAGGVFWSLDPALGIKLTF